MIRSMTAFASNIYTCDQFTLSCEIRSVNHRFSDITVKLPEWLRFAETKVRAEISRQLKRGKIECCFIYKMQKSPGEQINVDMDAVKSLLSTSAAIEQLMHSSLSFSPLDVLQFPGIQQDSGPDKEQVNQEMMTLLQSTLADLLQARTREGAQLGELITDRCTLMQQLVDTAIQRMPIVLEQLRTKIKNRVAEIIGEPDHERLEQEMVLLMQKLDVDEELDRLHTHISEVQKALQLQEPKGRRLDFLMQEMNREANTLGSKSQDKEMTQISIELKVLIEQMREQVQNIE